VDISSQLETSASVVSIRRYVDDLAAYPTWMRLVHEAERCEAVDGDPGPAWLVELRAAIGPLARSKRLRMVRVDPETAEPAGTSHHDEIMFVRREIDGRQHAPWVFRLSIVDRSGEPSRLLEVHLHYGGRLWTGGLLERVLADEIERGRRTLLELLSRDADGGSSTGH
jgi:hypothetical protein